MKVFRKFFSQDKNDSEYKIAIFKLSENFWLGKSTHGDDLIYEDKLKYDEDLKQKDDRKQKDSLVYKANHKYEDDLIYTYELKQEDDLKQEDNLN